MQVSKMPWLFVSGLFWWWAIVARSFKPATVNGRILLSSTIPTIGRGWAAPSAAPWRPVTLTTSLSATGISPVSRARSINSSGRHRAVRHSFPPGRGRLAIRCCCQNPLPASWLRPRCSRRYGAGCKGIHTVWCQLTAPLSCLMWIPRSAIRRCWVAFLKMRASPRNNPV